MIAGSCNQSNDFFGGTVNTAARIQGMAEGGEIILSQTSVEDEESKNVLLSAPNQPHEFHANLKGLKDQFLLYRL